MNPSGFYNVPSSKAIKVDPSPSPRKKKIEAADLKALEEEFSDFSDDGDSVTEMKQVVKSSPVKMHNRQFEQDFEDDLSEDDSSFQVLGFKKSNSKLTDMVREFSSSPNIRKSSDKLKVSQLNRSLEKKTQPEIITVSQDDFDSLDDDDFEEILAETARHEIRAKPTERVQPVQHLDKDLPFVARTSSAVSSVFTSSPSYHKTETLYKRVQLSAPKDEQKAQVLDSFNEQKSNGPFTTLPNIEREAHNALYPELPPLQSTPKKKGSLLYPTMEDYNDEPFGHAPQARRDTRAPEPPADRSSIYSMFKEPISRPVPSIGTRSIPSLLNKPKKRNSELLLLTQRPPLHEISQTRSASTGNTPEPRSALKTVQTLMLSEEQQHVVDLAKQGNSLFYTGSAGTGKSVLLRSMIKTMRDIHPPETVAVTASTGLAACNIGGITLHSFAGIGLGAGEVKDLLKKIRRSKKSLNRWKKTKVLVIDEISMIDGELFDKLDLIARSIRRNDEPFGGIQVIICGDFFQLPPVSKNEEKPAKFCFDSEAWKSCIKLTITLQQVFRQKGDMEFITMLNEMRLGKLSMESADRFRELERPLPEDEIEPAELYCTRFEVEKANQTRLNKLETPVKLFTAHDGGILVDKEQRDRLLANFLAPQRLYLKKGAQVMMIKNIDESLVNGSLGKVVDFIDQETYLTYSKVREDANFKDADIEEAIARAKEESQAMGSRWDGNDPETELEDTIFDFLDEVESDDPVVVQNIETKRTLIRQLHESSKGRKLPLVRFLTPDGHSRCVLVTPEMWDIQDEKQQPLVSRNQLPLILAWALSIHKSQGQTLPKVRVNLRRVFEKGQAYVALSRAVSRQGLQVLNFDASKVWAHDRVKQFYAQLKSAQDAKLQLEGRRDTRHDLRQSDIANATNASIEELEAELEEDHFVDAPSPSSFANNGDFIPFMTQDDSSDNIVLNSRNYKKRGHEYV